MYQINLLSPSSDLSEDAGNISYGTVVLIYKSARRHLPEDCDIESSASSPSAPVLTFTKRRNVLEYCVRAGVEVMSKR